MRSLLWSDESNCTDPAILEFPAFFTPPSPWAWIVPPLVVTYCVIMLVKVCDSKFVPCIKVICYGLGLSSDVAGATLMAGAVSSPDLFINLVGTFLTEGDIGVGTVLGCGVINTLAVPALCVLIATTNVIKLNYWSLSRDSLVYCVALSVLVGSIYDGRIHWHEAAIMVSLYFVYITVLACNAQIRSKFELCWKKIRRKQLGCRESLPLLMKPIMSTPYGLEDYMFDGPSSWELLWTLEGSLWEKVAGVVCWPQELLLFLTVPSCRTPSTLTNALTFFSCLGWIASLTYIVAWMITYMGFIFSLPDSLMGITFLAIGMSTPESITSIIVAKQGHGSMAISNALGSNIFDVLICLGVPWLIKAAVFSPTGYVDIHSRGLGLSTSLQVCTLVILYVAIASSRYQLTQKVGILCLCLYVIFAILTALMEMNVFFVGNLPVCEGWEDLKP